MRAVQRVPGLKRHNLAPAQLAEIGAQLIGRVAAGAEIIMYGLLDAGHRTAKIDLARLVVQVIHSWVRVIISTKNHLGFAGLVGNPTVGHRHGAKNDTFLITQCNVLAQFQFLGETLAHVQRDRHRPERAIGQPQVLHDADVIGLAQETLQRIEPTIHQKFQIADLARGQVMADQLTCLMLQLLGGLVGNIQFGDRR